MNPIRIYTVSLGCPKNRVDSERLLGSLGPVLAADEPAEADVIFVNTCGFIRPAVEESVRTLLDLGESLEGLSPRPLLAAAGCMVTRYLDELPGEMPEVDVWLPLTNQAEWPALLRAALGRKEHAQRGRVLSTGPGYAYLKVSEGCGHDCAFCAIPSIRGRLRSEPLGLLEDEARAMLEEGARELVLVAQDLTSYGADIGLEHGLETLLKRLLPLPGLARLRPMYLYPAGLTPRLLDFLRRAGPPLLPYFDIPLQHAHPEILSAMGRPFARDPRKVVDRVREAFPEAALRTSLIVGYPGETDAHFAILREFVADVRFTHLGVFAYEAEDGTRAAALPGQVEAAVKEARRAELMELQRGISREHLEGYVGRRVEVLVDAPHPEWEGLFVGRTWFQAPEADGVTYVSGEGVEPGMLLEAEVEEATDYDLVALK